MEETTGARLARRDFIGINFTFVLCSFASWGTGGGWSSCTTWRGTGRLERPPLILMDGSGGRGVVGEGMGGGPPMELRWVPVDLRLGRGLPPKPPSISALFGVRRVAEYVSSLPGLAAASSKAGHVGLTGEVG